MMPRQQRADWAQIVGTLWWFVIIGTIIFTIFVRLHEAYAQTSWCPGTTGCHGVGQAPPWCDGKTCDYEKWKSR